MPLCDVTPYHVRHYILLTVLTNIAIILLYLAAPPLKSVDIINDPCVPSPCGPYSVCQNQNNIPSCSCQINYFGSPPNCRPECTINADCPLSQACINEKCQDPCPGACGLNTECNVISHIPNCKCQEGYIGDAFLSCQLAPTPKLDEPEDPCQSNPCGTNAVCSGEGVCTCLADYQGDPYTACMPECVLNSECSKDKACVSQKCRDPCPGTCGANAICEVFNHIPMCHCPQHMSGNAFVSCIPMQSKFIASIKGYFHNCPLLQLNCIAIRACQLLVVLIPNVAKLIRKLSAVAYLII